LDAYLVGTLVGDTDGSRRSRPGSAAFVTGTVDLVVLLEGDDAVERTLLINACYAEGVAEGAVIAGAALVRRLPCNPARRWR